MKKITHEQVIERMKAFLSEMTIDDIMNKYGIGAQFASALRSGKRFPPRWLMKELGVEQKRTHVVTFEYYG